MNLLGKIAASALQNRYARIPLWPIVFWAFSFGTAIFVAATVLLLKPANAASWSVCGSAKRITCVVDGDTFWLKGVKYRLFGADTPEAGTRAKCSRERQLADRATFRLLSIFNSGKLNIDEQGADRYGRVLAVVLVNGSNVSNQLISEGVGKTYRGGQRDVQQWCQ